MSSTDYFSAVALPIYLSSRLNLNSCLLQYVSILQIKINTLAPYCSQLVEHCGAEGGLRYANIYVNRCVLHITESLGLQESESK